MNAIYKILFIFLSIFFTVSDLSTLAAQTESELTTEDFFRSSQFYNCNLSPDGSKVSYVVVEDKFTYLVIHDLESGEEDSYMVDKDGSGDMSFVEWANPARIVFMKESGSIYAINADGTNFDTLSEKKYTAEYRQTLDARDYDSQFSGRYSNNPYDSITKNLYAGRSYQFKGVTSIRPRISDMLRHDPDNILIRIIDEHYNSSLLKQNVVTGKTKLYFENATRDVSDWETSKDAEVLAGLKFTENSIILKTRKAGEKEWADTASFEIPPGRIPKGCKPWEYRGLNFSLLGFDYDPNILYIASNLKRDKTGLYAYNLEEKAFTKVIGESDSYDFDTTWDRGFGLRFCPYRKKLVGFHFMQDKTRYIWLDPLLQTVQAQINKALPNNDNYIYEWTKDLKKFLIISGSGNDPGSFYIFDLNKATLSKFASKRPWLEPSFLGKRHAITFESRDGHVLQGYLTVPNKPKSQPMPLVVRVLEQPWQRFDANFEDEVQFLAYRGYAVLEINTRGSSGYGYAHLSAPEKNLGQVMIDDLADGVKWVVESGMVDSKKIAIMGDWIGGYLTISTLTQYPEQFQCGISVDGVYNIKKELSDDAYFPEYWKTLASDNDREKLFALSPINRTALLKSPLLIVYNNSDPESSSQAKPYISKLKSAKKTYEIYKESDTYGYQDNMKNTVKKYDTMISFLDKYLK